jgi:tripartite-type tricarboxylate transporter receptor subunit TctC
MRTTCRVVCSLLCTLLSFGTALLSHAEQYPDRPIRLIVPYTTGGGTDVMARVIAAEMTQVLGQSVVVENKPGAGAIIGTDFISKAPPDGYVIGLIASAHTINPALYSKLPFDPIKGFSPVMQIASGPNVLAVNAALPAASLKDLIALLRAEPGRHSFGSAGLGNPTHLAGELFQRATQTKLIHVPYKGSGQAEIGLAGGEIDMMIDSIPAALPFIASGKTRALAVTGTQRFPMLPDVPTMAEAGLADYAMTTWWGVVAPPATPTPIVDRLNSTIADILKKPDVRKKFLQFGAEPTVSSPAEFGEYMRIETERYAKLVHAMGLQPLQ